MKLLQITVAVAGLALAPQESERLEYDLDHPVRGAWAGTIVLDDAPESPRFVHLAVSAGSAVVTAPDLGVPFGARATASEEDLRLTVEAESWRFDLEVDAGAHALTGRVVNSADERSGSLSCTRTALPRDLPSYAAYAGTARHSSGLELELAVHLGQLPTGEWVGAIDIQLRNVEGLPLDALQVSEQELRARVPGARPMDVTGTLTDESLVGELRQGAVVLELSLQRATDYEFRTLSRPQHPEPPFPYRQRDLVAEHPAGHTLAGTLTLPDPELHGPGPYAAAVLISGGGREDRDSSALGHKPFLVIADHLTHAGLAVFRFDDRGVGESRADASTPVGKDSTSLLLATDTAAVVDRLRREPELDGRIGLIGHSEGGMIAPLVTLLEPDVAFLVLLAGPGAPGSAVFRKQFELDWEIQGADAETIRELSERLQRLQAQLLLGAPTEQLRELERELADAWVEAGLTREGADPERARAALLDLLRQFDSPWWRFAFGYDPAPVLAGVRCPILALNGTKDRQVWHDQNLDAIEAAVNSGGGDVTALRYENRNHLFQPTETGARSEYAEIEITFDQGVLNDIVAWLGAKGMLLP